MTTTIYTAVCPDCQRKGLRMVKGLCIRCYQRAKRHSGTAPRKPAAKPKPIQEPRQPCPPQPDYHPAARVCRYCGKPLPVLSKRTYQTACGEDCYRASWRNHPARVVRVTA